MKRRLLVLGAVTAAESLVLAAICIYVNRYIELVAGEIEKEYANR